MEKKNIGDDENRPHRNLNRKLEGKLLLGKPFHSERMAGKNFEQAVLVCVWNGIIYFRMRSNLKFFFRNLTVINFSKRT
jgi:hypothetical protein